MCNRTIASGCVASCWNELVALHHFDLTVGSAFYRVFLLAGLLEVDIGFSAVGDFRSHGDAPFDVVFGEAGSARPADVVDCDHLAGLVWHHVLHARGSIERGRPWQAEYWISAARDHLVTLACHRSGHPTAHAKGADALPRSIAAPLEEALVGGLDPAQLRRALGAVAEAAVLELRASAVPSAERLRQPLVELAHGTGHPRPGTR